MRNKYKLLKWYPSLSSSWVVGMEVGQRDGHGTFANFSPCSGIYDDVQIPYKEIVSYPEFWEKIKEPLLTTEDGVNYYNVTDRCIWVDMKNFRNGVQPFITEDTKKQAIDGKFIFFSTVPNALTWIEENKPQFSKKDMLSFGKFVGGMLDFTNPDTMINGWIRLNKK